MIREDSLMVNPNAIFQNLIIKEDKKFQFGHEFKHQILKLFKGCSLIQPLRSNPEHFE